jgi:hypothetical protein
MSIGSIWMAQSRACSLRRHYRRNGAHGASLELTDQQQHELAKILIEEREHIRRVWQVTNVPPEYRASATRAIKDKAEKQIRAMLIDEQKKINPDRSSELLCTSKGDLERSLNPGWQTALW